MTCAYCGHQAPAGPGLCVHHHADGTAGWAQVNRLVCDLLHRGIVPARPPADPDDAAWLAVQVA
jgi:hypothetical protein